MLGRNGVDLRTVQELAGHSTPILTARYSHRRLYDLTGAVDKLPSLVPPVATVPHEAEIALRMTGTDATSGVPTGYAGRHFTAPSGTLRIVGGTDGDAPEPLEKQGAGTSRHRPASPGKDGPSGIRTQNQGIMSPLL